MQRVSADRLLRDLNALAADVDELITSTAGNATEAIAAARSRIEISWENAKRSLEKAAQPGLTAEVFDAGGMKAGYFRVNAWKAIGVAAGIGLLLGMLAGLKSGSARARHGGSK